MNDRLRPASSSDEGDPNVEKTGRPGPIDRGESGGAALTGETGALTPEDGGQEAFVPAELREASDPRLGGSVTRQSSDASAPHRRQVAGERASDPDKAGGSTNLADREGGYGGEHGLPEDDPAYRYDVTPEGDATRRRERG